MLGYLGSEPGKSSTTAKKLLPTIIFVCTLLIASLSSRAQKVYATTQDNAVTGICLLCGVSNPNNPVSNANLNDFSTFNETVGLLGVTVYQDLIFPGVDPDPGCDSLVVGIGNGSSLLTAALLGGITIQTYNGATANSDVTNVSVSTLRLLSSDTTRGEVFVLPQNSFDRVRVTLTSSLAGALSSFRLYYAYINKTILNAPTLSGGDTVTLCSGSAATLTASANAAGATLNWYTQASGGTPVFTGSSYSVSPTATTIYYVGSSVGSCTSPSRTAVTVIVNPLPPAAGLTNAQVTVCSGTPATFSVQSPQAGITYNWYTVASGGTPVASGTSYTIAAAASSQNYYVESSTVSSGCVSATRTVATLSVNPTPDSTAIVGANSVTVNQGQTSTFSVNGPNPAYTYNWYDAPSGGNLVNTGSTFTTPAIYAPASYYVSAVSNQGCTSASRTRVTVNVLTSNNITCGLATQQQSPVINGVCVLCTVSNPTLAVDGDPSTASTVSATVGALGYVGQLLQFTNTYPAGDSIVLELAIPSQIVSATLLSGIIVQTYLNTTANNDAVTLNSSTVRLQLLGGGSQFQVIIPAQNAFNGVLVSINGTVSLLSSLDIYYAAALVPRPTVASNTVNICGSASDSLTATGPAGATFNWYTVPVGGTSLATGATYVTPVLSANTTYYLESSQFGCANSVRTPIAVDINTQPAPPAVSPSGVTICSGDSATLSATAVSGATIKWYKQATGGTAIDSGASFTTPALTDTTTYYAEASNNGCVSSARTPIAVNVNKAPQAITVTPAANSISAGQTATFTASSASPGTQFNWYTQATGGTPSFTGATYAVSPPVTTTFYVAGVNTVTGCTTPVRTAVTVTVVTDNGPAVPCGAATTETSSVNGLCIGCSVQNEALAVDGDSNTGSTLNVTAGLTGANAQQTLIFPFTADAGDSIRIKFVLPAALVSVGALNSLQVATYNGNNYNNDQQSITSAAIKLSLLSGSDSAIISFAPASPYDRVQVQLNSGLASLVSTINIDYAASVKPSPTLLSDTVSVCSGQQTTLKIIAPPDATFRWYTTASGGSPIFTGATFQTPVLTDTTVYYAESAATVNGCINPSRTPVVVNVPALPAAPTVQHNTVSVCMGSSATLIATAPVGATFNWYTSSTGGAAVFTGDSLITPALDSSRTYYVAASNSTGCTSLSRTVVSANVVSSPVTPTITPSADTLCAGGSATLVAISTTPGVQFNWYASDTSNTILFSGANFTTPALNSTTTYYIASVAGSCASPARDSVTVTVNPRPAAPTFTVSPASGTVNSGSTATLTASSATPGAIINWYTSATGGSPVFTGSPFTTPALTTTVTYYAEAEGNNGAGCPSTTRTSVTINVTPSVNLGCGIANTQTNAVNGLCIGCSVTNPGNAVDADTTTFSSLNIGVSVAGSVQQTLIFPELSQVGDSVQFVIASQGAALSAAVLGAVQVSTADGATSNNDAIVLQSNTVSVTLNSSGTEALIRFAPAHPYDRITVVLNAGLVSALTGLNIYYATDQVNAPVVGSSNVTICTGTAVTLTASTSVNAAVEWFGNPTGGVALAVGDTFHTPILTHTTTYYAEALRVPDSCANLNRVPVTVSVIAMPVVPVVVNNPDTVCSGQSAVLQASAVMGTQILWFDSASGGHLLTTGNVYTTPALTASKAYFAAASNGTCSSASRDSVSVIVGAVPIVPVVQPSDTTICQGQMVTLSVAQPQAGVTYNWYTVLSGGTPVFTGKTFITPALNAGVTYYVEAVNTASKCTAPSARTQIIINVNPVPAPPAVNATTIAVCSGQPATAAVNSPQAGLTYQWYSAQTGGTLLFTGPSYTLSSPVASLTVYVQASSGGGGCSSAGRTSVAIQVDSVPAVPQLQAADVAICAGGMATFTVNSPQAGVTYQWYDAPTGGALLATGSSFTTPALNNPATYYVGAANAAGCSASSRTAANANVSVTPGTPAVTLSPVIICSGGTAALNVQNPQAGIVYSWYNAATGGSVLFQGPSFGTPVLSASTAYYVSAMNGTMGCGSSARTIDSVRIGAAPAVPVLAASSIQVCAGGTINLQVQSPQAGITYTWYNSPTSTTPLYSGTPYVITGATTSGVYYVLASTSGGCSSTGEASANVTVNPAPVDPVVQVPDMTVCTGSTATFTISSPQPGDTYSWYAAPSGGSPLATGSTFTTTTLAADATYYVADMNAGGCSSPGRTMVTVTVSNNLTPPQLVASTVSTCSGQPATLAISNPQGGITYNWYSAATGGTLVFQGPSYTLTGPVANDTLYVNSSASGGTCTSATRTTAEVIVAPSPAAPSLVNSGATVCSGGNVSLQIMNPQGGAVYNWYTAASGGSAIFSGTIYNLTDVTAATEYYVEADLGGCSSSARTPATVSIAAAAASPTVTASSTGVCPGSDATLTAASTTSGATFSWYTTATAGTAVAGGSTFMTGPLTSDTTFYVEAASTQGCSASTRTSVSLTQLTPLDTPTVSLQSRSTTSVTFQWTPVVGAIAYQVSLDSGLTFVTPTSGPTGTTETIQGLLPNQAASIEVEAMGASPCQTSIASGKVAGVSDNPLGDNIFVPNVFSPNGDGNNDILYVYSNAISSLVFRIYNQWGQEIFESRSINTGWDGTAGGQKQPVGVYIYAMQATMQDGSIINKKGSVTLIR